MGLSADLLDQAAGLARREPKRPKQASLRRAVSAAYYALFHLLTDEATQLLISGQRTHRQQLRAMLRRTFSHKDMKTACRQTSRSDAPWLDALSLSASGDLQDVASTFVDLQEERHRADYDHLRAFRRSEVRSLIARARAAVAAWRRVRGSPEADAFLVSLQFKLRTG